MRSLPARPAPSGAPPGGRQINSKDTQTSGSVVSKSQAAGRQAGISQSSASPTVPTLGAAPAAASRSVNAMDVYWADSSGRRNTPMSRGVLMGRPAGWMTTRTGRPAMRPPAQDPAGMGVEDEGDVDGARPGCHVGEVGDPDGIGTSRGEAPL